MKLKTFHRRKVTFRMFICLFICALQVHCFTATILSHASSSSAPTIILLDPFSETLSGYVREYCSEKGFHIIEAVSPYTFGLLRSRRSDFPASLLAPAEGEELQWITERLPDDARLVCCISESDAGVPTAERISLALSLPSNGLSEHLRNKYLMNVRLKANGLGAASQYLESSWESMQPLLLADKRISGEGGRFKCVVKPYRGVASDGVMLCHSLKETERAFKSLLNSPRYGGGRNERVLVQEFLEGEEYAIDTVSCGGVVKILAVWKYRKCQRNNAPFVYQCTV